MYQAPVIQVPGLQQVAQMADSLKLGIPEDQLPFYHEHICNSLSKGSYSIMEKYTEPNLQPVKYPRTPGFRPQPEDNVHNAWYYKCEIPGASCGPLQGLRVAIKDSIPVAGVPMMSGSRVFEGYVPDYDPTVITRILDAGATIVGKSTCEDLCFSGSSFRSHPAPVLNPYDTTRSSGGSSSGSAVLVHQGEVDVALGADQGGSIRIPASWTGIVGLKPTYGLVPYTGIGSMSPALDHCGPLARTVRQCALLLQVIAGDDGGLDTRQRNIPLLGQVPKYSELLTDDLTGIRVGLVTEGFALSAEDVQQVVRDAALRLRDKGAVVEDISIPIHTDAKSIWGSVMSDGAYHTMKSGGGYFVGPPGFHPTSAVDCYHTALEARSRDLSEVVKCMLLSSKYVADNYGLRFYTKSQNLLRMVTQKYNDALRIYDVIVMPTVIMTAHKLPTCQSTFDERIHCSGVTLRNTAPFNGTGHPSLSINAGYSGGLPVGMMITGRHLDDQTVLNVAYAHEKLVNKD